MICYVTLCYVIKYRDLMLCDVVLYQVKNRVMLFINRYAKRECKQFQERQSIK